MAILKNVYPPSSHVCEQPDPKLYGLGTVWECDICGRQARLTSDQRDGIIWMWLARPDYLPSDRSASRPE